MGQRATWASGGFSSAGGDGAARSGGLCAQGRRARVFGWSDRGGTTALVPCDGGESEDFFAAMEIAVVLSLLEVVDNPRQDVPLIAVLRDGGVACA